jgi:hypothetical protein
MRGITDESESLHSERIREKKVQKKTCEGPAWARATMFTFYIRQIYEGRERVRSLAELQRH